MKRRITAVLTALLLVLMCALVSVPASADAANSAARKFNVVFVVDASGSMTRTDPQQWRFEAIDEFLSLLSMNGNYVGTVVFNGDIVSADGVSPIDGKTSKLNASTAMRNVAANGYTNIGAALAKANELLKNGSASLPSVILLLSDGNTELPPGTSANASIAARDQAVTDARNNETKVYCIGLNANGTMDEDELANIAAQTNGEFRIVSQASDLEEVFRDFYKLIYGTGGNSIESVMPATVQFTVPKIGVEEVNILIDGEPTSITLTQPSGMPLDAAALNEMTFKGKRFTNIKMERPLGGSWTLQIDGDPNQTVTINFIPNLNVGLSTDCAVTESFRNTAVTVNASIVSYGQTVTDPSVYQEYPAALTVTNADNSADVRTVPMTVVDGKYSAECTFETPGVYYITSGMDIGYGTMNGNTVSITVRNSTPVPVKETVKIGGVALLFGKKTYNYDLAEYIVDEDDTAFTYVIESNDLPEGEALIDENGALAITPAKAEKGSMTVRATDSMGESCVLQLEISYKSFLLFLIIGVAVLALLAVAAVLVLKYLKGHKPYGGSVSVAAFDENDGEYGTPQTEWPGPGPLDLKRVNYESETVGGVKGVFTGAGKNKDYILFTVKGVAYHNAQKVKTVQIYDNCPEKITSREDGSKGVEITYTKQNSGF